MDRLVKVNNGVIEVAEELMLSFHEYQVKKAEMEMKEKEFKDALLKAMENNEIKSFENDFVKVTYKAPSTRKSVDANKLKEQGLYDLFVKESKVKSSVVISWK